jgi:ethanolamine-phosphate cytidylyltransferase
MDQNESDDKNTTKEIRIFMDGAFDLMHYGHMNAFRLGRSLGTYLVVGVNSDTSIAECKGAPLMNDHERLTMVRSCKFVDEVIPDCPYIMNAEYVNWVIREYKIDYVVHGDDPCIVDGKDVYAAAKEAGKFRTIPRTHGISSTDVIGRMLQFIKLQQVNNDGGRNDESTKNVTLPNSKNKATVDPTLTLEPIVEDNCGTRPSIFLGQQSKFLTTTRLLHLFFGTEKVASLTKSNTRTVYIDGAWDLFHPGHVAILKAAKDVSDVFK